MSGPHQALPASPGRVRPAPALSPRKGHSYRAAASQRQITRFVALTLKIQIGAAQRRLQQEFRERAFTCGLPPPFLRRHDDHAWFAVSRDRLWRRLRPIYNLREPGFCPSDRPTRIFFGPRQHLNPMTILTILTIWEVRCCSNSASNPEAFGRSAIATRQSRQRCSGRNRPASRS